MMDADKAATIGENSFDLKESNHVGHPVHYVLFFQYVCCIVHNFFNGLSFAGALKRTGGNIGYRLRIVELKSFLQTPFGNHAEREERQFVLLFWC